MIRTVIRSFVVCIFAWAGSVPAQASGCPELLGRWGYGLTFDVASDGEYVYVGNGSVLQIYGIADPANPVLVSEIMLDGFIRGITLDETVADRGVVSASDAVIKPEKTHNKVKAMQGHAFIAADRSGMIIVDVTDPIKPTVAGRFQTNMVAWSVAVMDHHAFVSDSAETTVYGGIVHVLDVSDAGKPREVNTLEILSVRGLAVRGDHLFAMGGYWGGNRTLDIIDIGDPTTAQIVATIPTETSAEYVVVHGLGGRVYAYICGHLNAVRVADVTDPLHPVLSGFLNFMAIDIAFWGTTAYAASEFGGMNIYDMSDPLSPNYLGGTAGANFDIRAYAIVAWRGEYVYIANYSMFSAVDVRAPSWPNESAVYESGGWTDAVTAEGAVIYAAFGKAGIKILDFSDPSTPKELSRFHSNGQAFDVLKEGDFIYVADNPYLSIYDVSNSSNPMEVSRLYTGVSAAKLAKRGNYIYVMGYEYGLIVAGVADPKSPFTAGQLYTATDVRDIVIEGSFLYLADADWGLCVIDIVEPEMPRLIWTQGNASAYSLAVADQRVYIANWDNYLFVYDISEPHSPQLIAQADVGGRIFGPVIRDGLAFAPYSVQEDDYRIIVLDILDPHNIKEVSYISTEYTFGLAMTREYIFGKNQSAGVAAFDLAGCGMDSSHVRPLGPP